MARMKSCYLGFLIGVIFLLIGGCHTYEMLRIQLFGKKTTARVTGYREIEGRHGATNKNERHVLYEWKDTAGKVRKGYDRASTDWKPDAKNCTKIYYLPDEVRPGGTTTSRLAEVSQRELLLVFALGAAMTIVCGLWSLHVLRKEEVVM